MKRSFESAYTKAERRKGGPARRTLLRSFFTLYSKALSRRVNEFDPDVIVSTHTFAGMLTDIVRRRSLNEKAKLVGVVTDFTVHPYWEECVAEEALIVANDRLVPDAEKKGFDPARVYGLGIPVEEKYAKSASKEDARLGLGLDPALPCVMVMSGSMGHGRLAKAVREIDGLSVPLQIVCVCGNNSRARRDLEKYRAISKHALTVYGFTHLVDRIMDAADLIVTKPGGLSGSEALAKNLPIVIFDPIPGHEKRNLEFLTAAGAALDADREGSAAECVRRFFSDEGLRSSMKKAAKELGRPDAARDACELVLSLCGGEKS
jgi:processive 1,2-diacylglycerol beta-glucosyltransferase